MFQDVQKVQGFLQNDIRDQKVLVFGDVMLDRYYFGEVKRISPEAPVPVARIEREKDTLGGAANVALNLFRLGASVKLIGIVGRDENYQRLARLMEVLPMATDGLVATERPTTTKLRVIGGHQQMLRLDFEQADGLSRKHERAIKEKIDEALSEKIGSVIISDYAKGVCSLTLCHYLIEQAKQKGIPVIIDPKGDNWKKYAGASFITPNVKELAEVVHSSLRNANDILEKAAFKVKKRFSIGNIILTRSEQGMSIFNDEHILHIPTLAQDVFDVSGAGDTVIAVMGAALAGKLSVTEAALLANLAAGYVVGKVGTYAIQNKELQEEVRKKNSEAHFYQEAART